MTRRVSCMERHTAKYSEIQPNSIQPAIQPCRACRGSGAWPGCAQAAVHAAMGAGYRPTPSVTPSSPTGTLSACVSVRHLVLYSRNTIQLTIQLYCSIHVSRIVTPSPRRHTAIQRHTALYEHTAIQHHTAYTPYNTPQLPGVLPPPASPVFPPALATPTGSAASGGEIGHSPPPIALCCAAPLRPSRAARRRDGCRDGNCVIVCVCVLCVGQRGQCGRRGHAGRPLNQSSAGNVVVQSPPSAGSRRCCIPRARACRAPLEASRRARRAAPNSLAGTLAINHIDPIDTRRASA